MEHTMTYGTHTSGSRATSLLARFADMVVRVTEWTVIWRERTNQRAALGELNDRLLKDIGISRGEAEREMRKGFWRG
jgi:uncharacterized protein YjiS (DUF1127 family)